MAVLLILIYIKILKEFEAYEIEISSKKNIYIL